MNKAISLLSISFLSAVLTVVRGQVLPEYNMANMTVTDCDGILKDSEAGTAMSYDNNENFTFIINTGGRITLTFSSFNTEAGNDTIRFFDGPNLSSPKIGITYSGNISIPPIVSNSGYLTIHFKSDNNVIRPGWLAQWQTDPVPPIPPIMTVNPVPACNATTLKLSFDKKIACNPIFTTDFNITGPLALFVSSISAPGCLGAGDSTTVLNLALTQPISINCDYQIQMDIGIADNCDSIWNFILSDTFQLNTCPFTVDIISTLDTLCPGTCTEIEAVISGNPGNCLNYNYNWNQGLPNSPGPHMVCPTSNTNYTVSVQQVGGGPVVSTNKTLTFVTPTIITADSTVVCQSDRAFTIAKSPFGGNFVGNGITDPVLGIFDPDVAGGGNHKIKYNMTAACYDSIVIIVKPIDVGINEAACPGVAPFLITGSPTGGIWSGDSISPGGLFNPATSGTFNITYSINGCTDSKKVFVDSINLITPLDTVCESDSAINIQISPPGGIWNGIGITDSIAGIFDPNVAGPGDKLLVYKLNGCNFQINVHVNEIEAGNNAVYCPFQAPLIINPARPAGGIWSGLGFINPTSGLYDPGKAFSGANGNDTITYTAANGCTDKKVVYVRNTRILYDTLFFCTTDTAILLDWANVNRTPCCGIWTGPGLQNSGRTYYFHPSMAGVGVHTLTYSRNTCSDTIKMVVHPTSINFPDSTVCNTHPSFTIASFPAGGRWVGGGINAQTGVFNPATAPIGVNFIRYESPTNCVDDTVKITVYPYEPARISGIDSVQCFKDTALSMSLVPLNGQLTGVGLDSNGKI